MDRLEYRAVIRFLVLEGVTPKEIHDRMEKAYGELAPSPSTVKKWASEFKRGRTNIKDDPREGRPRCATGADVVNNVLQQVTADRRLKVREIAEAGGVSTGSTFEILTKQLHMRKLYGRWVPITLTEEQKATRIEDSKACLMALNNNNVAKSLEHNCVNVGEIWIHIYTTTQVKNEQDPPPIKLKKVSTSSEKILALVFWDARGVILIDYLDKGNQVTGEYYSNILEKFNEKLQEKRFDTMPEDIYFYQDITPTDNKSVVSEKLAELKFRILEQPPQSPDLSPSDYHLFPKLENFLQAKRFTTIEEATAAVDQYFEDLPVSNFRDGLLSLEKRWNYCLKLNGNYIEPNSDKATTVENYKLFTQTDNV